MTRLRQGYGGQASYKQKEALFTRLFLNYFLIPTLKQVKPSR
jgi:hypothetical protein